MICIDCGTTFTAHDAIIKNGVSIRDPKLNYWKCKSCNKKKEDKKKDE